jgi:hypothetical protein
LQATAQGAKSSLRAVLQTAVVGETCASACEGRPTVAAPLPAAAALAQAEVEARTRTSRVVSGLAAI